MDIPDRKPLSTSNALCSLREFEHGAAGPVSWLVLCPFKFVLAPSVSSLLGRVLPVWKTAARVVSWPTDRCTFVPSCPACNKDDGTNGKQDFYHTTRQKKRRQPQDKRRQDKIRQEKTRRNNRWITHNKAKTKQDKIRQHKTIMQSCCC